MKKFQEKKVKDLEFVRIEGGEVSSKTYYKDSSNPKVSRTDRKILGITIKINPLTEEM